MWSTREKGKKKLLSVPICVYLWKNLIDGDHRLPGELHDSPSRPACLRSKNPPTLYSGKSNYFLHIKALSR